MKLFKNMIAERYEVLQEIFIWHYMKIIPLKKSNNKVTKSIEIINMLTSRIKMETYFTKKECEDVQNYIYLAMNNF